MYAIDQIQMNFSPASLVVLNIVLAIVIFGVALELRVADFRRVLLFPRAYLIGLLCQFLLMPAAATAIVWLLEPAPSMALGIILVAACPGGNVSNFFASLGKGNAALSVSMSATSSIASVVMTPFNFAFWGSVNPHTSVMLQEIAISPLDVAETVLLILVIPTVLAMWLAHYKPALTQKLVRPMRIGSIIVFLLFVVLAAAANWEHFVSVIGSSFIIVLLVNGVALLIGYWLAFAARLPVAERRAVCFETGIQNSGFGLILIFNFFAGLGGMAVVAAWWGIWHLVTGLSLALYWSRQATSHD